jgi:hypothetical protein
MGACNEFSTCIHVKSEARLLFGKGKGGLGCTNLEVVLEALLTKWDTNLEIGFI